MRAAVSIFLARVVVLRLTVYHIVACPCNSNQRLPRTLVNTRMGYNYMYVLCSRCSGQAKRGPKQAQARSSLFGACPLGHRFRVGATPRLAVVRKLVLLVYSSLSLDQSGAVLVRGRLTEVTALLFTLTFRGDRPLTGPSQFRHF